MQSHPASRPLRSRPCCTARRHRQKHLRIPFSGPVFIDTEGGTKRLNVARLPQPTSWAMLLDEVAEVRKGSVPCGTLVN